MDPQAFLEQTITGKLDTRRIPVPAGEYPAIIDDIGFRDMDSKQVPGTKMYMLEVTFAIDDAVARDVTGLPKPTVRQTIFLDVIPDATKPGGMSLDMSKGRNVQLGALREALGLNDADKPFSFLDLKGQACYVQVVQNPGKGDELYANVNKVGKTPVSG